MILICKSSLNLYCQLSRYLKLVKCIPCDDSAESIIVVSKLNNMQSKWKCSTNTCIGYAIVRIAIDIACFSNVSIDDIDPISHNMSSTASSRVCCWQKDQINCAANQRPKNVQIEKCIAASRIRNWWGNWTCFVLYLYTISSAIANSPPTSQLLSVEPSKTSCSGPR